jgi:hypothetical protein
MSSTLLDIPTSFDFMASQPPSDVMVPNAVEPQTPASTVSLGPKKRQAEPAEEPEGPAVVRQKLAGVFDFDVLSGEQQAGSTGMEPAGTGKMKLETLETFEETPFNSIEDIFEGLEPEPLTSPLNRAVRKLLFTPFSRSTRSSPDTVEKHAIQALNARYNNLLGPRRRSTGALSGMPAHHKTEGLKLQAMHMKFTERLGAGRDDVGVLVSKLALKALQFQIEVRGYSEQELDKVWANYTKASYAGDEEWYAKDHMELMRANPASWYFFRVMKTLMDDMRRLSEGAEQDIE